MNTSGNTPIIIDAPAKLTLSLRVTGVREDGFHLIDAEMVTLDLVDKVRITPNEDGLNFEGPFSSGISTDSDNLVSRALVLAGRRARVHVEKNIPSGGGLGGGSADVEGGFGWKFFNVGCEKVHVNIVAGLECSHLNGEFKIEFRFFGFVRMPKDFANVQNGFCMR